MNNYIKQISKNQAATFIAILFHTVGLIGLLFFNSRVFVLNTPLNLLLMFLLILWTQKEKNAAFYLLLIVVVVAGFAVEVLGVNTGLLFGKYKYGNVLGYHWMQVPFIIGINWFIIIYCCGISTQVLLLKAISKVNSESGKPPLLLKALSVIIDGATLAVMFDWLMEPVAVKLGFWQWLGDGKIPLYNYICWFGVSALLLTLFHF